MKKVIFVLAMLMAVTANAAIVINSTESDMVSIEISDLDLGLDITDNGQSYEYIYNPQNDSIYVTKRCLGQVRSVRDDLEMAKVVLRNQAHRIKAELQGVAHEYNPIYLDISFYATTYNLSSRLTTVNKRLEEVSYGIDTLSKFLRGR